MDDHPLSRPESAPPERASEPSRGGVLRAGLAWLWGWTRSILIAFVLFLILRTFVVEAFTIPTASMENTLLVGDFLLVNKAVYGAEIPGTPLHLPAWAEPRRGDVIVFNPPHDPTKNYVKRVVGIPGDTLQMRGKILFVNGRAADEPYARYGARMGDVAHPDMNWQMRYLAPGAPTPYHPTRDNWGPIVVPRDRYFVLGDNRDNSEDSRYWGFVPRDAIRGRPWFVYFSVGPQGRRDSDWLHAARWGRVGHPIR
ncbi:MAG: signal peptidase I [Gemmatimonadota bacterium]